MERGKKPVVHNFFVKFPGKYSPVTFFFITFASESHCLSRMSLDEKKILEQKYSETVQKLEIANAQLKQANQKLKEYEEKAAKAEKASQMKSLFLANMSHEIRRN